MGKNNINKRVKKVLLKRGNQNGASLLFFISLILLISVLSASVLNLTTTSTFSELSFNHLQRAYYLAEAGLNYYEKNPNIDDETFTIDGAGQFHILVESIENEKKLVHSTGSINTGISSNVEVRLTSLMDKPRLSLFEREEIIFSYGEMELGEKVSIEGDIGTSSNNNPVPENGTVRIEGSVNTQVDKAKEKIPFSCPECNEDFDIEEKSSIEWPSGTHKYKSVTMEEKSTLIITGKVVLYVKEEFKAEEKTTIRIGPDASLTIFVDGEVEFEKKFSVEFNPLPNRAKDFVIYGTPNTDSIEFEEKTTFIGGIYAPYSEIKFEEKSTIIGSIIGDTIEIDDKSNLTFDPDVLNISTPVGDINESESGKWKTTKQYFSQ